MLTSAHGTLAYTLVFGFLIACGLGLPLPEDVALVTGGYLSFVGAANLWLMVLFARRAGATARSSRRCTGCTAT
jgi:membrane protein DedA with SNARE-associated domain